MKTITENTNYFLVILNIQLMLQSRVKIRCFFKSNGMHLKNVYKTSKTMLTMLQKHSCQCTVRLQYWIHITDAWESSRLLLQLIKAKVIIVSLCTVVKFNVLYHTISLYHYLYLVGTDIAISAWPVISKNRHELKHTKVKTIYFIHPNKGCLYCTLASII